MLDWTLEILSAQRDEHVLCDFDLGVAPPR
jgi:hypothetical protein